MATITAVLWTYQVNPDGTSSIRIRVAEGGETSYRSTGLRVKKSEWNSNKAEVRRSHPNAAILNASVSKLISEAEGIALELQTKEGLFEAKDITERLVRGKRTSSDDIFKLADSRIAEFHSTDSPHPARRYRSVFNKLREYHGASDLPLTRITPAFLRAYEGFLYQHCKNSQSTVASDMKAIRAIVKRAVRNNEIKPEDDAFLWYSIREPRSTSERLSMEEISRIEQLQLEKGSRVWHAKNCFLFSFYTAGMRFTDLCKLTWTCERGDHVVYTMQKSGRRKQIRLVPQAKEILRHYRPEHPDPARRVFPLIADELDEGKSNLMRPISSQNAMVNRNLKKIARLAGIDIRLTFHTARHSFADYMRRSNSSLYDISKAMGHSDLKITERYLASFDESGLDKEMDRIFG
ncbi:MAG: site-specific integrase [Rhodothermales bacterium]